MQTKDTIGGIFTVVALGVPPGLGSHVHWDRKLEAQIMMAMGSIQAIKGVEIGPGFANATKLGSEVHDRARRPGPGTPERLVRHPMERVDPHVIQSMGVQPGQLAALLESVLCVEKGCEENLVHEFVVNLVFFSARPPKVPFFHMGEPLGL